jgi:NADH-quinone oxidoreductase subunit N
MAAFLCIGTVYNISGKDGIEDFTGLAKRSPGMAMVMTAALFSLAGLPIFAGFTSKFYLFNVAAVQGLLWLAGIAIFTSLISLYYYLMVIRRMYIESTEDELPIQLSRLTSGLLAVLFLGIVLLGIYPAPLMDVIYYASDAVLSSESVVGLISN